jgi:hypothetical protein
MRDGIGAGAAEADDRAYASLLGALARELADAQALDVEAASPARRDMADVKEEEQRLAEAQFAAARRDVDAFRTALLDARRRSGPDGSGEAAYDAADPAQDATADLLIRYLVRTGYAEVRTEEPAPGRYRYFLRVAWDRLRLLAGMDGHRLPL